MPKTQHVSRRDFVTVVTAALGTIIGAVIGLPAIGFLISPAAKKQEADAWIPAGPLENFPIGTPTLFNFTRTKVNGWEKTVNSYGAFILRDANNQIKALSNICTHLSCRVNWDEASQTYPCPCHDAHFDINGAVLSGPPPRPLDVYETKIEDGTVFIHYVEA
jgi:Rieske Fe-S protein